MSFNLGSRLVKNQPLADYLSKVGQSFSVIELHADPSFLSPYFTYNIAQKKTLRVYQERYSFRFTMHAPFNSCHLGALDPEVRHLATSSLLSAMRLAADLEIAVLTFHPTVFEPNQPELYPANCRMEESSLAGLLSEAKRLGLRMLIENMPRDPLFHPSTSDGTRLQELLWLFPESELGLTIDVGHALQAGTPIESLLKMDRIQHFHFHENDRVDDLHTPIITNQKWWLDLIKKLTREYPDAAAVLELDLLEEQLTSLEYLTKPIVRPRRKIAPLQIKNP